MYRPRETTENLVVMASGTGTEDLSAWDIEKIHRNRGCNGLGCHFLITRDGDVHGASMNPSLREKHQVGNMDSDRNEDSVFILMVGSHEAYTEAQEAGLNGLLSHLEEQYPEAEPLYLTIIP